MIIINKLVTKAAQLVRKIVTITITATWNGWLKYFIYICTVAPKELYSVTNQTCLHESLHIRNPFKMAKICSVHANRKFLFFMVIKNKLFVWSYSFQPMNNIQSRLLAFYEHILLKIYLLYSHVLQVCLLIKIK